MWFWVREHCESGLGLSFGRSIMLGLGFLFIAREQTHGLVRTR